MPPFAHESQPWFLWLTDTWSASPSVANESEPLKLEGKTGGSATSCSVMKSKRRLHSFICASVRVCEWGCGCVASSQRAHGYNHRHGTTCKNTKHTLTKLNTTTYVLGLCWQIRWCLQDLFWRLLLLLSGLRLLMWWRRWTRDALPVYTVFRIFAQQARPD